MSAQTQTMITFTKGAVVPQEDESFTALTLESSGLALESHRLRRLIQSVESVARVPYLDDTDSSHLLLILPLGTNEKLVAEHVMERLRHCYGWAEGAVTMDYRECDAPMS